jgi:hypothetical protein
MFAPTMAACSRGMTSTERLRPCVVRSPATSRRLGHGIIGAAVAAWPAVALVGSELLMVIIRGAQASAAAPSPHDGSVVDPLEEQPAVVFAAELAADRVPSVRAMRAVLHVG